MNRNAYGSRVPPGWVLARTTAGGAGMPEVTNCG